MRKLEGEDYDRAIIEMVVHFRGTARQSDDITVMLVGRDAAA